MERFDKFDKEMQSLKISGDEHYLIKEMNPVKVQDVPGKPEGVHKMRLLRVEVTPEEDLNLLFMDARRSVKLLEEKQLRRTLVLLKEFDFWPFLKRLMNFYVKFHKGEQQPMDEMDLKTSLRSNFICTVPDERIDSVFLDELTKEVMNKRSLHKELVHRIEEMLGDVAPEPGELFKRLNKEQTEYLYRRLSEEKLMESSNRNFGIVFGEEKGYFEPIKWMAAGYVLRKLLINLKNKDVTDKKIVNNSAHYFINKNGEPLKVSDKPNRRYESEKPMIILTKILEKMATLS